MAPRTRLRALASKLTAPQTPTYICQQCRLASMAAVTPAAPRNQILETNRPIQRYPANQPPSHKPAEFRKTQLHRQYQSMLRSSPLMLVFQHNNMKALEWMGIQRELANAMRNVDEELAKSGNESAVGRDTKMQVVQTGIFASAMRVVEFWTPQYENGETLTHGLSEAAWKTAKNTKLEHGLEPLLSGPIAVLTLPAVSTKHVKAALSVLAPSKEIPAPKRKTTPSYHEPAVLLGVQKLMLLGARIEGKAFDVEGTKWVAGIEGGLEGLRGQLVALLQMSAASLTSTLEGASRSLYLTMEGRKTMLEEEQKAE